MKPSAIFAAARHLIGWTTKRLAKELRVTERLLHACEDDIDLDLESPLTDIEKKLIPETLIRYQQFLSKHGIVLSENDDLAMLAWRKPQPMLGKEIS